MKGDEQRKAQPRAAQSDKGLRRMLTLGGLLSEMQAHKCDRCRRDGPAVIPCEVPAHSERLGPQRLRYHRSECLQLETALGRGVLHCHAGDGGKGISDSR